MNSESDLAWIASLVGDPARLRIMLTLMDGRARTAKELAYLARIAAPTASGHLAKLLDGRLVAVEPQGRHRYFRLASPQVGQLIEALAIVASDAPVAGRWRSRVDPQLARARTCYDHLAGRLGVALSDALLQQGHVALVGDGGEVTPSGRDFFATLGLDLGRFTRTRRVYCRPCLDWTERRHHLAGVVGAALCAHCLAAGWVRSVPDSRALTITATGEAALAEHFGLIGLELEPDAIAA